MLNRQCKVRLSKWYTPCAQRERERITREIGYTVTHRSNAMCNFVEWRDNQTIIYKRYAGLYFIICADKADNELLQLELIHRFVYILDKYFGSVTELDIIYDFTRAYIVLDELLIAGEQQECSAMEVLRIVDNQDEVHKSELLDLASQTIVPIPKL